MEDFLKYMRTLELAVRHRADARVNEGCRHYWVEFDPTIRNQYFRIEPRHRIAPSIAHTQEFVVRRMDTDGIYREIFSLDFRRTTSKEIILDVSTSRIEKWLDEEAHNHPMEEYSRLYGDPFVERNDRVDLMDPERRAAKNARAEALEMQAI
ncbi:hypothetical protein [Sinorhizobium meliloti]|uniref:hypothetical protein n=1 Tax=Rhizobium meliloti TaxID=382 RepID=UPI000FDA6369|nr:hypothetical protein [Sinorhizobium meliloti]RVO68371.1 hypothetical protein CN087_12920 [Sinorhizobium meliloti]